MNKETNKEVELFEWSKTQSSWFLSKAQKFSILFILDYVDFNIFLQKASWFY